MAIAFSAANSQDALTASNAANSTGSISFSITSGSTLVVWMQGWGSGGGAADSISTLTYNGVALTKISTIANGNGSDRFTYVFVGVGIGTGSAVTLLATANANFNGDGLSLWWASYTGVGSSGVHSESNTGSSGSTFAHTTSSITNTNSWVVAGFLESNGTTHITASSNISIRTSLLSNGAEGDTNGVVGGASWTMTVNCTSGATVRGQSVEIVPTGAAGGITHLPYLNLLGVGS